jgi:hypothetical protein
MPCRIAEAILTCRMEAEKPRFSLHNPSFWSAEGKELSLPFLAIESDGNPFSQLVEERLESFIMAAHRLRESLAGRDSPRIPEASQDFEGNRGNLGDVLGDMEEGAWPQDSSSAL